MLENVLLVVWVDGLQSLHEGLVNNSFGTVIEAISPFHATICCALIRLLLFLLCLWLAALRWICSFWRPLSILESPKHSSCLRVCNDLILDMMAHACLHGGSSRRAFSLCGPTLRTCL